MQRQRRLIAVTALATAATVLVGCGTDSATPRDTTAETTAAPVQPDRTIPPFDVPMATLPEPDEWLNEITPDAGYIRVWTDDHTEVLGYVLLSDLVGSWGENALDDGSYPPIPLFDGHGVRIGEWKQPINPIPIPVPSEGGAPQGES